MKVVSLFNNKGGVGKSTLTYHLAFALERLGNRMLLVDADPQCNLSAHLCDENTIQESWERSSLYQAVEPLVSGGGDYVSTAPYQVPGRNIWLFIGDLLLSDFESLLSQSWVEVLAAQQRGFRITSALYRLYSSFAKEHKIDYVLIDVGPNLGSLNRSLLLGCDHFIVPMIPDLFSLRGSQNLGRVMSGWARDWHGSVARVRSLPFDVQAGLPLFTGYILQQFNIYRQRPTKAWKEWANLVPHYVNQFVVQPLTNTGIADLSLVVTLADYKIGEVKNYHSLIPMAQSALKPIFELTSSDGVVGAHHDVVDECGERHGGIAERIIQLIR